VVIIQDTGVGIPGNEIDKLFNKFFRGSNVKRLQTDGSGLGLFIAKNIIEKHGGSIHVESQEGSGTKVTMYLLLDSKVKKAFENTESSF